MSKKDFCGIIVEDYGDRWNICVTDIEVDMRGAKDQIHAEDLGFV